MIFVISVLPALFPFFFFTKLLTALGAADNVSHIMQKPIRKLYNAPKEGGYILLMSVMSGYPIGAKLISDFYSMKAINTAEAKKIAAFTSSSGPLFILGTLGASILNNYKAGIIILISHYLATIINGFIYRGKSEKTFIESPLMLTSSGYDKALSESVYSAIISILTVGSYIAIFNLIGDMLIDIKILPFFENAIQLFLKLFKLPAEMSRGISFGIIEITRGSIYLSESGAAMIIIVPIISFLVTLGGLSIAIQSLTYLSICQIKPGFYIITKLSQSMIAFILSLLMCLIIPF